MAKSPGFSPLTVTIGFWGKFTIRTVKPIPSGNHTPFQIYSQHPHCPIFSFSIFPWKKTSVVNPSPKIPFQSHGTRRGPVDSVQLVDSSNNYGIYYGIYLYGTIVMVSIYYMVYTRYTSSSSSSRGVYKPLSAMFSGVCLKMLCTPKPNGFADHYPVFKWLAISGNMNPRFSDKPSGP